MKIERFEVPGLAQYSYVVASAGEAIVIDPMRDFDRYVAYAAEQELVIRYVTETHIHADFASGAAAVAAETGAELAVSGYDEGERYVYSMPHRKLLDGEVLRVGKVTLRALHTPGHTPEHLSFLLFDEERTGAVPVALFSGDFLFVGSLGRPDLLGDAEKHRLAEELYRSVHERIAGLPDGLEVYPGHGAGSLCGAGIGERPESTLGYERATQRLFGLGREAFLEEVLATVPPMPAYYPRMKALNAEGARSFREVMPKRMLSAKEVQRAADEGEATLLDLRRQEAFGGAHVPGSVNIGAGQNLSLWAGWMLDPGKPIVLISDSGKDEEAARSLVRVGLDEIAGSLKGGIGAWVEAGMELARIPQLSTEEVLERDGDALVLDVRSAKEWSSGHIAGAEHVMLGDLPGAMGSLPKVRAIVTVCGSGYRSSIAASLLQAHGFARVSSMDGGMGAWNRRGLPVE